MENLRKLLDIYEAEADEKIRKHLGTAIRQLAYKLTMPKPKFSAAVKLYKQEHVNSYHATT